jgi:hypothetical protein
MASLEYRLLERTLTSGHNDPSYCPKAGRQ